MGSDSIGVASSSEFRSSLTPLIGAVVEGAVEFGLLAGLEHLDGTLQQVAVEGEADLLDLAALLVAEQLSGAADLQVVGGQRKAGAQIFQGLYGLQALGGIAGHGLSR